MNPYEMSPQELIARTLMGEAGQQPYEGQLAAAAVMDNRRKDPRWGNSFTDVIMQPGQFSLYNDITGYAGGSGANDVWRGQISPEAMDIANRVTSGDYEDPTGGATHYYNPALANPSWARGASYKDIGAHRFLNADAGGKAMPVGQHLNNFDTLLGSAGDDRLMGGASPAMLTPPELSMRHRIGGALSNISDQLIAYGTGRAAPEMLSGDRMMARQRSKQGRNATADYLHKAGMTDLANAVLNGGMSGAQAMQLVYARNNAKSPDRFRAPTPEEIDAYKLDPTKPYRVNEATGKVESVGGGGIEINTGIPKLTEGQAKATMYHVLAKEAMPTLDEFEQEGLDPISGLLPTIAQTPEYRAYDNAAMQFASALLRIETGQAATIDEIKSTRQRLIPVPGDPPSEIERKRKLRAKVVQTLGILTGPGAAATDALGQPPQVADTDVVTGGGPPPFGQ